MRKVRITSDGRAKGTSVVDSETGEPIPDAYAFEVSGSRLEAVLKATVFCYMPKTEIVADANIVHAHPSLIARAIDVAEEFNDPKVFAAMKKLLGTGVQNRPKYVEITSFPDEFRKTTVS